MRMTGCSVLGFLTIAGLVATGCASDAVPGADGCGAPSLSAGWHSISVQSGHRVRELQLYAPKQIQTGRALPLVFDLHGSFGYGMQQAKRSDLAAVAERHGFLVANPDGGIERTVPPRGHFWHLPGVPLIGNEPEPSGAPDDVQFISDAIDQISTTTCVDAHRIYATGFSNGGRMSSWLACHLADRIAAVAPVAGIRAGLASNLDPSRPDPGSCRPVRPVPIIAFHGVHDPVNLYAGGGFGFWGYSVDEALRRWAALDQCQGRPQKSVISAHVTEIRYGSCAAGSEVILYRIDASLAKGGGHVWPGSSDDASGDEINASELIWEFFARHPS
jgi:polyhydroxybutyrate depolymerase